MAHINYKALLAEYSRRGRGGNGKLLMESEFTERLQNGDFKVSDINLGRMFEEAYGWHNFRSIREAGPKGGGVVALMEATGGVTTAAFASITGQVIYTTVMDSYQNEDFVFTKLIPERISPYTFEKVAGVTEMGDFIAVREESAPYGISGLSQDWLNLPEIQDRGTIVPVTWEAIFYDRTGQVPERAGNVGHWAGINKEKRATDCVFDINGGAKSAALGGHEYYWRNVNIGATYAANSGNHNWQNLVPSNGLVDWTSLNASEQVRNQILDPNTGEPVIFKLKHLVVPKSLEHTARRIQKATSIKVTTPGYATTGNPTQTEAPNPYAGEFEVITSRYVYNRLNTAGQPTTSWIDGDITKAFVCAINEPLNVVQAPANNLDEFNRQIILQFRVNLRENFSTWQPRAVDKNTA